VPKTWPSLRKLLELSRKVNEQKAMKISGGLSGRVMLMKVLPVMLWNGFVAMVVAL